MNDADQAAQRIWEAITDSDARTVTLSRNDVIAVMRERTNTFATLTKIRALVHAYEEGKR